MRMSITLTTFRRRLASALAVAVSLTAFALQPPGAPQATGPEKLDFAAQTPAGLRKAPPAKATQITAPDLAGKYMVFGYTTANAAQRYWLDITCSADGALTITNLMDHGTSIPATFDQSRQVIVVKPQKLFSDPEYGDFYMYVADVARKAYFPSLDIEFAVNPDGTITTGNWGAFVTEGEKRGYASIHHRELMYPARATITDYTIAKTGNDSTKTYPAVYVRENNNKILIKNFFNYGADVVMTVDSLGKVNVGRYQLAQALSSTGSITRIYDYGVTNYVSPDSYTLVTGVPGTFSGNTITLGRWAAAPGTTVSKVYELFEKSVITVPETFTPFSSALQLQGKGTAQEPYLVSSATDLLNLSAAVNYSGKYTVSKKAFKGVYFKQTADIDMSAVPNFEPIGFATASTFDGIYDGNGHKIKNLHIDRREEGDGGLFGIIEADGVVKNVVLESPSVKVGKIRAGSVAGHAKGSVSDISVINGSVTSTVGTVGGVIGQAAKPVDNCTFSGSVEGTNFVGGIIGQANCRVSNCFSTADIVIGKKDGYAGGVVGTLAGDTLINCAFDGYISDKVGSTIIGGISGLFQNGVIMSCLNSGHIYSKSISTNTTIIGGICGTMANATIRDCHVSGWLESPDAKTIVGMLGKNVKRAGSGSDEPKLSNSLFTGMIVCPNSKLNNEYISTDTMTYLVREGLMFDKQTSSRRSTEGALSTSQLTTGQPVGRLDPALWKFEKDRYPALKAFEQMPAGLLASAPFFLNDGDDVNAVKTDFRLAKADGIEWKLVRNGGFSDQGNGLKIDGDMARITATSACTDTLVALKGDEAFRLSVIKVAPIEFEGKGTAESPYLIKTIDDLIAFRNAVDLQVMRYTGLHFRLAADLDMKDMKEFIGLSSQGKDNAFNGTFDGAGHYIKNWTIDRAKLSPEGKPADIGVNSLMAGFFLYTGPDAVIRNINIDSSCFIQAGSHVAAVVSQNFGTVEGCVNYGHVRGLYNEVGGVVAYNAADAIVRDCRNAGRVDCGRQTAGGVVGANLGLMERCQNDGPVTNDAFSTLSPGRNLMGAIGGITGYNNGTVKDCLGAGTVAAPRQAAAIVGENRESGLIVTSLATAVLFDPDQDASQHGAIMGIQQNVKDTLSNIYYDEQLTARNAGNRSSQPGVTGLTTARLTSGSLPEGFDSEVWSAERGRYPILSRFADADDALFNASVYLQMSTSGRTDTRFFMRRPAVVRIPEDATAELKDGALKLSGISLSFGTQKGIVADTLIVTQGKMVKKIPVFACTGILAKGDGSEQNPYLIEKPADWNTVANMANNYELDMKDENFRIEADLDFTSTNFSPICQRGTLRFQGSLDGAGHTLDNIKMLRPLANDNGNNLGLFGIIGEYGNVSNITLGSGCQTQGFTNVGGIAGQNAGVISNCTNRAKVSATNTYSGGMAGYVISGGRFIDCVNHGAISCGGGQAGGIAGGNGADIGGLIKGCSNFGTIFSGERSAGGIIGSGRVDVVKCENRGDVRSTSTYAGGIVGYHTYAFDIDSCVNRGKVVSDAGIAGGIVGFMFSAGRVLNSENLGDVLAKASYAGGIVAATYRADTHVVGCVNRGSVKSETDHAGGIVGYLVNGNDSTSLNFLRNSVNYGKVTAVGEYAGGVLGEGRSYTRLYNLANYGDVEGDSFVGGIAGCMLGTLDSALNTAKITARRYTVGGIVGVTSSAASATASMRRVFNAGEVSSLGTTDGTAYNIGGILGAGNVKLTDAYNVADLTGHKAVGGIVGLGVRGVDSPISGLYMGTCISRSYNAGSITCLTKANEKYCGHIVGASDPGLDYTEFADNYFDLQHGSATTFALDSVAKGINTADFTATMLGDEFTQTAAGLYPVLKVFADHDAATAASSAVMLPAGTTRHAIDLDFKVNSAEGVEWSSDSFTVKGSTISWSGLTPGQAYPLVASKGDFSRTFMLTVSKASGIIDLESDDANSVVSVQYYTIDGHRLPAEAVENGAAALADTVVIRIRIMADGSRLTDKIMLTR